jgi:hypothetical protein
MDLKDFEFIETALIEEILKIYLARAPQPNDHEKCITDDYDPYNKILSFDRKKIGTIKIITPTEDNIEYSLKFIPIENWLK